MVEDWERRAQSVLKAEVYDFFAGGAGEEFTLRTSTSAWDGYVLRPHILRDVSRINLSTTVLGTQIAAPFGVAPTGYQRLAHEDGERGVAEAAASVDVPYVISSRSMTPLEDLVTTGPRWFQTYVLRDRQRTLELIDEAKQVGCCALVVTVDAPVLGYRRRDHRNKFVLPATISSTPRSGAPRLQTGSHAQDPSLDLSVIAWLRAEADLPIVVKGILREDDAQACVDAGASAIWVSAHGGRQLDGAVSPAHALQDIVDAVAESAEVYVDGGIDSGVDAIRALALGARCAFLGRGPIWGLAADGTRGARSFLEQMVDDLRLSMQLTGMSDVTQVTADLLRSASQK